MSYIEGRCCDILLPADEYGQFNGPLGVDADCHHLGVGGEKIPGVTFLLAQRRVLTQQLHFCHLVCKTEIKTFFLTLSSPPV